MNSSLAMNAPTSPAAGVAVRAFGPACDILVTP